MVIFNSYVKLPEGNSACKAVMNWKVTCLKPHFQDNLLEAATVRRTHLLDGCQATGYHHGTPFLSWTSPSSWPTLLIRGCRQPDLTGLVRLSRLGVSDGLVPHKEPHVMSCWSRWHLQTGMAHDIFCQQIDWRWPFKDTKHFVCDCQRCTDDCDPCRGFRQQSLPKVVCFENCAVGFLSRNSCFSKVSCGICLGLCPVDTCKNDDFGPWLGTPGRRPRCLSASLKLGACGDEVSNGWGSENRSLGNRFVRRSPPHTRSTCKCVRVRSSFDQRMDCVSISHLVRSAAFGCPCWCTVDANSTLWGGGWGRCNDWSKVWTLWDAEISQSDCSR